MLKTAGDAGVGEALMPMLFTQTIENLDNLPDKVSPDIWLQAKSLEYARHLRDYPIDILKAACDAHVVASKFFPAVAEIAVHARPLLEARQRQAWRIEQLIRRANTPKLAAFVPDPEHVRLLMWIKWHETPGAITFSVDKAARARKRLQVLVDEEIAKANDECRSPAEWTTGNESIGVAVLIETPSDWKTAGVDDLLAPQASSVRGARTHTITDIPDEPPLPDMIPE